MKTIFVAGTDTGSGKTVVTGLLAGYLSKRGFNVATQKWAETGSRSFSQDVGMHLKLMGKRREDFGRYLPSMTPYLFRFPSSPHLAASAEGRAIDMDKIRKSVEAFREDFDYLITEGTGGLMVPLNRDNLLIDVIEKLRMPVLLVAINRLGAINHSLLSLEALRSRKMRIVGIIFNNVSKKGAHPAILNDNPAAVNRFSGVKILGALPYAGNIETMRRSFDAIGDRIAARL